MKILKLIALLAAASCFSCSSGEPESIAKVEQEIRYCSTPAYVHVFSTSSISRIVSVPPGSACPAVYYPSEPVLWNISRLGALPPNRADGKCSCEWISPGLCYNQITNGPVADYECYAGACYYYRSFQCGYGTGCAHKVSYSTEVINSNPNGGNWNHAQLWIVASEPGCQRTITVDDFHTLLP